MGTSLLETRLLENAVQRTRSKVIIGLSGNGHPTRFRWVFVLSVAATGGNKVPAIILEHSESLADLHTIRLSEQFEVSNTICIV